MAMHGSYAVARDTQGNYSVYYRDEYIGSIARKGVSHFEVDNRRFDRLFMAVKHMVAQWIETNKDSKKEQNESK